MATDPVERIRSEQRETPFTMNLRQRLHDLAHVEPSIEHPYVSAYIDWRPEGENPGVRPGKTILENDISAQRRAIRDEGKDITAFDLDVERITAYIEDGIDPAVHGVFILANETLNIFEVVQIAMPMESGLTVSPTPNLRTLMAIVEDFPRFAVLHGDQHDVSLYVISRSTPQSEVSLESNEYPRKQSQGGWSQRRFRARQDERLQGFARAVAEHARKTLDDEKIDMLVLSVGEVFGSALNDELHQTVKEAVVGEISLAASAPEHEIVEAAQEVAEQAERAREVENIARLNDAIGSGSHGASGSADVLRALSNGQVSKLLMAADFAETGWADFTLNLYGVGNLPVSHPAGGDVSNLASVDLAEEMVRLALATGALVEIVPSQAAARLHEHGGVGALLRY